MPPDDPANAFVPYPFHAVANRTGGPLAGLDFAVKDLFDVAGYPTGAGSPTVLALSGIKTRTAPAVTRLLEAGARFIGKTHTDEFAFSINGRNAHFGTPRNGAAPGRIPGGSSSGSASAVSNGLCDFALGTDTGGSVRAPSSHCGLWGLRPTHDRITLDAVWPLAPSFDTCGFFSASADVLARVGEVLLGADPVALPARVRLLDARDAWDLLDAAARGALDGPRETVRAALDAPLEPVSLAVDSFDAMLLAFRRLQGFEAWQSDGALIERHRIPLGPGVAERFAWGKAVSAADLVDARAFRARFSERLDALLGDDAVMLLPTMPDVAPLLETDESSLDAFRQRAISMLCAASLAGVPQLNLPLGRVGDAPIGLSLIGPRGADRGLIALGASIAAIA